MIAGVIVGVAIGVAIGVLVGVAVGMPSTCASEAVSCWAADGVCGCPWTWPASLSDCSASILSSSSSHCEAREWGVGSEW